MSTQISKSLYIFYEIVSFLPYEEKLRMQRISKKFYNNIIPYNISSSSIRSASHAKSQDRVYQYASGYFMYRDLNAIIEDIENDCPDHKNQKWQPLLPENEEYVRKEGLNKQLKFGRTLYIPYNKLLVISGDNVDLARSESVNDTFIYHTMTNTVERMPDIRLSRTSFAAHYDFGDRYVYVIGGSNRDDKMMRECEKFDIYNEKWIEMPKLNGERGNPGTFISKDRRYLYAFQGFKNTQMTGGPLGFKQSEALSTIERLDLWNESAGWEQHNLSIDHSDITKQLRPKGCFVMYNLHEFDFDDSRSQMGHQKQQIEEEKEHEQEDNQINSFQGINIQKNDVTNVDQSLFQKNVEKYSLRDKILIFGGWQPYENLQEIEVFDAQKNEVQDILPLALNLRGNHYEAKKSILQQQLISASTAHESNQSNGSDSIYADDEDLLEDDGLERNLVDQHTVFLNRNQSQSESDTVNNNEQGRVSPGIGATNVINQRRLNEAYDDDLSSGVGDDEDEEMQDSSDDEESILDYDITNQDKAATDNIEQLRKADQEQRKHIYFKYGDKFTKKPLQYGKYLVLLGRMHIQVLNIENFTTKMLPHHGEDQAERLGQALKTEQLEEGSKNQKGAASSRNSLQQNGGQTQLLSLNPDQVRTSQRSIRPPGNSYQNDDDSDEFIEFQ